MSVSDFIFSKFKVFTRLLRVDQRAEEEMKKQGEARRDLDSRLERVTRATLNGETEWFLTLIKKDPDCALEVIKDCDLKENE